MKHLLVVAFIFILPSFFGCVAGNHNSLERSRLESIRVTPSGDGVTELRQIVLEFDKPMVSLGEMSQASDQIPVKIVPHVACEWRWINESSLSCNLDEKNKLSLATKYEIKIAPMSSRDGAKLKGGTHVFTTQLPTVDYAYLEKWISPERPVIHVWTNQVVKRESIERALQFSFSNDSGYGGAIVAKKIDKGNEREWLVEPKAPLVKGASLVLEVRPGLVSLDGPEEGTERKELFAFDTFADFAFIGIECTTNKNELIIISPKKDSTTELGRCSTMSLVSLLFNAPVSRQEILKHIAIMPEVSGLKKAQNEPPSDYDNYQLTMNHKRNEYYRVELPQLNPFSQYAIQMLNAKSTPSDLFGRKLTNEIFGDFNTEHLKPNLTLPYSMAVLEKNVDSDVVMRVTNLNSWEFLYHGFDSRGEIKQRKLKRDAPREVDIVRPLSLGIRDLLNGRSGVLYGTLTTDPLMDDKNFSDIEIFAQVTPFQVHVKLGHFTSLIWVTDLATGEVVKNAKVAIIKEAKYALSSRAKPLALGRTDENGVALLEGTSKLDPDLELSYGYLPESEKLFVRVDKGDDVALLQLDHDFEVSVWRASNGSVSDYLLKKDGHMIAWGTTAQGVYKLGDKIQYKIYVRNQNNETLTPADPGTYLLRINDPTGKTVHEVQKLTLSKFGGLDGEVKLPKNGAVGWYQFEVSKESNPGNNLYPMRVLVSDFTPSPVKVTQELNGDSLHANDEVSVSSHAKLHSGGGFANAHLRLIASVERRDFAPNTKFAKGFEFSSAQSEGELFKEVFQKDLTLDKNGDSENKFTLPNLNIYYGELRVESAIQDDRGKNISVQSRARYASVDRFVGLKRKSWLSTTENPIDVQAIVVDIKGDAVAGIDVKVEFEQELRSISRVKDVGSTYSTHVKTTFQHHSSCEGTSNLTPLDCQFKPSVSGIYRLTARIRDSKNKEHVSMTTVWVSGKEPVIWDEKNGEFLEIEPENLVANVGDKARFLVKNPYPGARALVTVERYGVIDQFVRTFKQSTEIIELPIKKEYLPGFYLSVIIQSPRIAQAKANGQLDLGKPTFSMGYIDMPVVDRFNEIEVSAHVHSQVYRPRDKVKLKIKAKPKGKSKGEPIELAVAVVDESVFDLLSLGDQAYDPYRGLYRFDSLDLRNFSLLTRLVGRQKLETKGANPGGGGGFDVPMRSLFKYVGYWNPSLQVDKRGEASIEFDAPDNLTGWKVLAMAVTPSDRAGLGVAHFKVNRPTEIRPNLPNQVTEGDTFSADFTVMNRTHNARDIKVEMLVQGDGAGDAGNHVEKLLTLNPYERKIVSMQVKAKELPLTHENSFGEMKFKVTAKDKEDSDGLMHVIKVVKKRTLQSVAFYKSTTENLATQEIVFPKNIYTDVGNIEVKLSPTIISSLEGAFRYLRDYPYNCFEQKLSKAVMAQNYGKLKQHVSSSFSWENSENEAQELLEQAVEFQAPNGGMCFFGSRDEHVDPYLTAYTALALDWFRQDKKEIPSSFENKLYVYLDKFLKQQIAPEHYSKEMTATVRATALAALAAGGKTKPSDISRFKEQFGQMNLMGKSHFIQAALQTPGSEKVAKELVNHLLSNKSESGGKIILSDVHNDGFTRILSTPMRNNCSALSTLVMASQKLGPDSVKDFPSKLVRTIIETRKNRDHFENTQENMFCMRALADYSRVFESEKTNFDTVVRVDEKKIGFTKFTSSSALPVSFVRPVEKNDPGKKVSLNIEKSGEGRLYYSTILTTGSRELESKSLNAGMDLKRRYSVRRDNKWVPLDSEIKIKRSETVLVELILSLPRAGNFVVVSDPIAGGLEPINQDLATSSNIGLGLNEFGSDGDYGSSWHFYHKELRNDRANFYADYLPKGTYRLSYAAQAISIGKFTAMNPVAEEMYNPDVMGKDKAQTFVIGPRE